MKFNICVTGEFDNIKGMCIAQKYYVNVQCGGCNTQHAKSIFLAEDNSTSIKVKDVVGKQESFNVTVHCRNCENIMGLVVTEPENQFLFEGGMRLSPVVNDKCHISTIVSDSAVVTDVDGLILDVVSEQNEVFRNCSFNERTLAEDDKKGSTIDILKLSIEVEQVQ